MIDNFIQFLKDAGHPMREKQDNERCIEDYYTRTVQVDFDHPFADENGIVTELYEIIGNIADAKLDENNLFRRIFVRQIGYELDGVIYQFEHTADEIKVDTLRITDNVTKNQIKMEGCDGA